MATEHTTPSSDRMTFYDNYKTPLDAGSYRFVLQQTVTVGVDEPRNYYRDQRFEVLAPRYTIEGSEIQAYFPPPGGVADYRTILPHLVLRSRSLPWERVVWPDEKREPWLALLVLSEQDVLEGKAVVKTGWVADLVPQKTTATSESRTEGGVAILLPNFTREEDPKTPVRLLDLDLDLFLKLCPTQAELPLLAHIRRVDTTDKVPLEMAADGEFSVLVANRFPPLGASTIHLISLEGWKNLIGSTAAFNPISRVRLITLASWSFVNNPAGHDTFGGLMQRLRSNASVFGVSVPAAGGDGSAPPNTAYVKKALARGYVPIDYQPLESTATFAWYRGPLSPLARPPLNQPPFRRADAALIFDESNAIMDVSYAAAWQLGRLLALASPAFSKGLRLFVERRHNADEFAAQIKTFVEMHRGAFGGPNTGEQIAIADELIEWIGRLVMLYPVPFHYLVPHPALLPLESLRFFHLDNNWVDALVDGALSTAVRNLADQGVASRAGLQAALSRIVYQHRLRLQGKQPESSPSESYMTVPKSGFLLRSSIVSGWPGVEVTVETDATKDAAIPEILRLDPIADGVLFCLARGCVKKVTFREPREGITFGVDTDSEVRQELQRAGARDGVVDIAALSGRLAEGARRNIGPAEFALQMIRKPEEQVIEWG